MIDKLQHLLEKGRFKELSETLTSREFQKLDIADKTYIKALYLIRTEKSECQKYIPESFSALRESQQPQVLTEFADYLSRNVSKVAATPIFDELLRALPPHDAIVESYLRHLIRHEDYQQALSTLNHYQGVLDFNRKIQLEISILDGLEDFDGAIGIAKTYQPHDQELIATLMSHAGECEKAAEVFESVGDQISEKGAYELSLNLLNMGDYHRAWKYYESRPKNSPYGNLIERIKRNHHFCDDVRRAKGPIFVSEQGFGDQLIFLRFASQYKETVGARARILVDARLRKILDTPSFTGKTDIEFVREEELAPLIQSGHKVLGLASLPRYLQILQPDGFDYECKYPPTEYKDHSAQQSWQENGRNSNIVGVAWRSSTPKRAHTKHIPINTVIELAISGKKLLNLNFDSTTEAEIKALGLEHHFVEVTPPSWNNLEAVYTAMQKCCAFEGLSSTYAHLGQLFDLPTRVLIPKPNRALWYWQSPLGHFQRAPWYQGIKLAYMKEKAPPVAG